MHFYDCEVCVCEVDELKLKRLWFSRCDFDALAWSSKKEGIEILLLSRCALCLLIEVLCRLFVLVLFLGFPFSFFPKRRKECLAANVRRADPIPK